MKLIHFLSAAIVVSTCAFVAAGAPATPPATPTPSAPAKPVLKITPGQVIVPTDRMRRIWGELVSVDLNTRTGKFRHETTNEIISFTVMPYAELLHHASFGDLQDFKIGTRGIFRLHENEAGEWVWLTYIQDEMNFLNGHNEYYCVDRIDPAKGEIECSDISFEHGAYSAIPFLAFPAPFVYLPFVREKGILLETNGETRYWKQGQPAKFADIQIGNRLRTSTHGIGKGRIRICWEVFLDPESLLKFQGEQKALENTRLKEEGSPGYIDKVADNAVSLTLFQESSALSHLLKPGMKIRVAPAGVDRKPTTAPITGTVSEAKIAGNLGKITVTLDGSPSAMTPGAIARLWQAE